MAKVLLGILLFLTIAFFTIKPLPEDNTTSTKEEMTNEPLKQPELTINQEKEYTATLETEEGNIVIALNSKDTPITANNFIYLSRQGFYDNTIFHRVIDGFMIQGGDPDGTGMGGPGYRFEDEEFEGEYTRGTVAMANSGPNTNGSQFFIMHQDYALPKDYVIFGRVVEGMETVDKIATAETEKTGEGSRPVNPVSIKSVTINEN